MKVHKRTALPLCAGCLARRHQTGTGRVPSCSNGATSWAFSKGATIVTKPRPQRPSGKSKESCRWIRLPQCILCHCYTTCMTNYCKSWTHRPLLATCDKAKHTGQTSWWMHTLPFPGAAPRMSATCSALLENQKNNTNNNWRVIFQLLLCIGIPTSVIQNIQINEDDWTSYPLLPPVHMFFHWAPPLA